MWNKTSPNKMHDVVYESEFVNYIRNEKETFELCLIYWSCQIFYIYLAMSLAMHVFAGM